MNNLKLGGNYFIVFCFLPFACIWIARLWLVIGMIFCDDFCEKCKNWTKSYNPTTHGSFFKRDGCDGMKNISSI
jgi:hypothetical protein